MTAPKRAFQPDTETPQPAHAGHLVAAWGALSCCVAALTGMTAVFGLPWWVQAAIAVVGATTSLVLLSRAVLTAHHAERRALAAEEDDRFIRTIAGHILTAASEPNDNGREVGQ